MATKILRPRNAAEKLGTSLRQVYNLEERDPDFPPKVILSKRCVGWTEESLDAYIQKKQIRTAASPDDRDREAA